MTDLASDQLAAISRLFSSSVVREMARRGKSRLFARLADQSGLLCTPSRFPRTFDLFDAAFNLLRQDGCRHEYVYKSVLTHKILLGTHSLHTASMLNEFRVGPCKADLAIINGTATVYEVKSERDSLSRLERQVAAYATVFARIYVIAGDNHVDSVLGVVPRDVGVLRLENRYRISTVRKAADRPERTSPVAIFDSIRTSEAKMILRARGVAVPNVPNTELHTVLRSLFARMSPRDAHEGMVRVLKKTRNLQPLSKLVDQLPHSLQPAALSVPLRRLDHARLVAAVNTPLVEAMTWA